MSQAGKFKVSASTTIKEFAWNGTHLLVHFLSGKTYQYTNVSEQVFVDMSNAPSVGKFLNSRLKGKYNEFEITLAEYTALTQDLFEYQNTRPIKKVLFDFGKVSLRGAVAF
ncbi:MAG: KTSC domain-containing protein [Methylophilus sp.]|uniref:KTSC domain-containing protein n=1 Tax=Methylophilus sp. TaxID=29541 RepID=UPI003F9F6ED5